MNLIVAYKRITDNRLIEEANLSILNFHMGAKVRNQYNVINIHSFQELITVVNVSMKMFLSIRNRMVYLIEFMVRIW